MPRRFIYPTSPIGASGGAEANAGYTPPQEPPGPTIYFQDDFESGTLLTTDVPAGKWKSLFSGTPLVGTTPVHAGTYSMGIEYTATYPASDDTAVVMTFSDYGYPSGLSHYFFRGYLYQKTPEADTTPSGKYQGKLVRFWSDQNNHSPVTGDNEVEIGAWNATGGVYSATTRYIFLGCYNASDVFDERDNLGTYGYDSYHCIEFEALLNTPGVADGTFRVWVDNTMTYENTAISLRGTSSKNSLWLYLGEQVSPLTGVTAHEFRYWDSIVVSDTRVGL